MEHIDTDRGESIDDMLNPHRREDRAAVTQSLAARLTARGVVLLGSETSEDVGNLLEAVERFEHAVVAHGGDLMVDAGPNGQTLEPDEPRFVLPKRAARESVEEYLGRLDVATSRLWRAD